MKTQTEISENRSTLVEQGGNVRHFTTVISKQTWVAGKYAGKSYRITEQYSGNSAGFRHVMLNRRSEPWTN